MRRLSRLRRRRRAGIWSPRASSGYLRGRRATAVVVLVGAAVAGAVVGIVERGSRPRERPAGRTGAVPRHGGHPSEPARRSRIGGPAPGRRLDVYAADRPNALSAVVRGFRSRVYAPDSASGTVEVIDPRSFRVVRTFSVGALPQHVTPAYDLRRLWVDNDQGNSLTPIDPATGRPGRPVAVTDPYNLYFTPDGRHAIVVAERLERLDFRDPRTMRLERSLRVPCPGVDHLDFSADARYLLASCEFGARVIKVDLVRGRVAGVLALPAGASPQDVKLSPDGRVFYAADKSASGVYVISGSPLRIERFVRTGAGAHGLYVSRDSRSLYVTNRAAGTVSVISVEGNRMIRNFTIPGGSPDMGGGSADGRVLWLTGRYSAEVYALSTRTGRLLARIRVGQGPHGLCVYPQPGRFSLGHTGVFR